MSNHWPVFVAVAMVGAAAYFGYTVQCDYEEKGKVTPVIRALPQKYIGTAPAKTAEGDGAHVQQPAQTATLVNSSTADPIIRAATVAPVQPVAATRAPAVPAMPTPGDLNTIVRNLRIALAQRFAVAPIATPVGYAVAVDGARIEVDAQPAWSIAIYNDNKNQPMVQSENFVTMVSLTAASLECDMTAQAQTTADGKITRRPMSKLGKLSILTDPAMNNSMTIRPLVRKLNGAPPNANTGDPFNPPAAPNAGIPAQPQPAVIKNNKPIAPPKPPEVVKNPAADQF